MGECIGREAEGRMGREFEGRVGRVLRENMEARENLRGLRGGFEGKRLGLGWVGSYESWGVTMGVGEYLGSVWGVFLEGSDGLCVGELWGSTVWRKIFTRDK